MNIDFTVEEQAFRDEVRRSLAEHYPDDLRYKQDHGIALSRDEIVRWQKVLYELGWIAPNYPEEFGGPGWTPVQKYIFETETARINTPRIIPFGLKMVGPVLYTFGNREQQDRFLPDILKSNVWWCQGYSEAGSGSDLASLKTEAVRAGDHYLVNGTKFWTTLAQHADWIFLLARTNREVARRQEGISFLLCDMRSPGVSVRPIITIEGGHEVNEVHFENVQVPVENLVGEEGKGWTYGKLLLQHERTNIADVAVSQYRLDRLRETVSRGHRGGEPLIEDPVFWAKLAKTEIQLKALEIAELRTLATVAAGKAPGPESSILKIKGTELQQAIDTLFLEAYGYYALPYLPGQLSGEVPQEDWIGDGAEARSALRYFNFRKASIYGGSNEIQKNIIAKHVLGL